MVDVVDLSAGCEFLSSPIAPPIVAFHLVRIRRNERRRYRVRMRFDAGREEQRPRMNTYVHEWGRSQECGGRRGSLGRL